MAGYPQGNVVANVMDHLEGNGAVIDFGASGSGAAINKLTCGGWFIPRQELGTSLNKCVCAFRTGALSDYIYLGVVNVNGGHRFRPTVVATSGTTLGNHYARPTAQDSDGNDIVGPAIAVGQLWFVAVVWDFTQNPANGPDTLDLWLYSPVSSGNFPLQKITLGHSTDPAIESNSVIPNTNKFCLGGWSGSITDAAQQDKVYKAEFQDWFVYPDLINDGAFYRRITKLGWSSVESEKYLNISAAGRRHWAIREASGNRIETYLSADDLAPIGTVNSSTSFSGTKAVPVTPTPVNDTFLTKLTPTTEGGASGIIKIGRNSSGAAAFRALFRTQNLIAAGIPAGSRINQANLRMNCTVASAFANTFYFVPMTNLIWVEGTSSGDGANWNTYDFVHAWITAGGDYNSNGKSADYTQPTSTGIKSYDIAAVAQWCLEHNAGDMQFLGRCSNETAGGTTGNATYESMEGATPWTLDIIFTPPNGYPARRRMTGLRRYRRALTQR